MGSRQHLALIVCSDERSRSALSLLFGRAGFEAAEVEQAAEALAFAERRRPALVVLDSDGTDMSSYELCHQLRGRFGEELVIIMLSGDRTESEDRVAGLLIGADDYVTKPFEPDELVARARRRLAQSGRPRARNDFGLTPRELEVLRLIAEGLRPEEISRKLFISPKTAGTHIQRILQKLGVHSRTEAVVRAYQAGLAGRGDTRLEA